MLAKPAMSSVHRCALVQLPVLDLHGNIIFPEQDFPYFRDGVGRASSSRTTLEHEDLGDVPRNSSNAVVNSYGELEFATIGDSQSSERLPVARSSIDPPPYQSLAGDPQPPYPSQSGCQTLGWAGDDKYRSILGLEDEDERDLFLKDKGKDWAADMEAQMDGLNQANQGLFYRLRSVPRRTWSWYRRAVERHRAKQIAALQKPVSNTRLVIWPVIVIVYLLGFAFIGAYRPSQDSLSSPPSSLISPHAEGAQGLDVPVTDFDLYRARSSWEDYQHQLVDRCSQLPPIFDHSYRSRIQALADHLDKGEIWVAEPGTSSSYYTRIDAGTWSKSERVFLVIVHSSKDTTQGQPMVTILTPRFELDRAKLLRLPGLQDHELTYVDWPEEANPFVILRERLERRNAASPARKHRHGHKHDGEERHHGVRKVFVDSEVRSWVSVGIEEEFERDHTKVRLADEDIRSIRERKSKEEIDHLRCANELTIEAIRMTRKEMYIGITESETRWKLSAQLKAFGLSGGGGLVLFGEDAALPHGKGTDRALQETDFALIDAGGSFRGYISDITRTFALNDSRISEKQEQLWNLVKEAQAAALQAGRSGATGKEVDEAARSVINHEKLGRYFTHRLGHGIGLDGHESPYLVGSNDEPIKKGNVFSDEPGIYIVGEVGVRLEDCWFVNEHGRGEMLTGPAQSMYIV